MVETPKLSNHEREKRGGLKTDFNFGRNYCKNGVDLKARRDHPIRAIIEKITSFFNPNIQSASLRIIEAKRTTIFRTAHNSIVD